MKHRLHTRIVVPAVVMASLALLALGAQAAQGQYSPVTKAEVTALALNHYFTPDNKSHRPDFAWTFTQTEFVIKKGKGAIPADLHDRLLPEGTTADEIRGKWSLAGKDGQKLVLTGIKAGDNSGKKEVSLTIYKTAPTVVRIGEPQYVFGLRR
jgi:hypothetical protein